MKLTRWGLSYGAAVALLVAMLVAPALAQAAALPRLTNAVAAPNGRIGHTAVWDPDNSRMLVFGGLELPGSFDPTPPTVNLEPFFPNDLWSYSPLTGWQQLVPPNAPGAPPSRIWHSAAWDPQNHRMLIFGGIALPSVLDLRNPNNLGPRSLYPNDLWAYSDLTGWQQLAPDSTAGPPRRFGHTAVWDNQNRRLLVWGGISLPSDLTAVAPGPGPQPPPRPAPPAQPPTPGSPGSPPGPPGNPPMPPPGPPPPPPSPAEVIAQLRPFFPNDVWQFSEPTGWQQVTPNTATGASTATNVDAQTLHQTLDSLRSAWPKAWTGE